MNKDEHDVYYRRSPNNVVASVVSFICVASAFILLYALFVSNSAQERRDQENKKIETYVGKQIDAFKYCRNENEEEILHQGFREEYEEKILYEFRKRGRRRRRGNPNAWIKIYDHYLTEHRKRKKAKYK